jgi:hypothetical protein
MTRTSVWFTNPQRESIRKMAAQLGCKQGGVFKAAFALLQIAIREQRLGNKLAIVRDGQVVREIVGVLEEASATLSERNGGNDAANS